MAPDICCPICFDPLIDSKDAYLKTMVAVVTDCGHTYHEQCLLAAFKGKADWPAGAPAVPAGQAGAAGADGFAGLRDYAESDDENEDRDEDEDDDEDVARDCPTCPLCKKIPDECDIAACEGHYGPYGYDNSYRKVFFSYPAGHHAVDLPVDATSRRQLALAEEMREYVANLDILLVRGEGSVMDRALERGLGVAEDDDMVDEYLFGGHDGGEAGEDEGEGQDDGDVRAARAIENVDRRTMLTAKRTEQQIAKRSKEIEAVMARVAIEHSTLLMRTRVNTIAASLSTLSTKLSLLPICLRQARLLRKKREFERSLQDQVRRLRAKASDKGDQRPLLARIAELDQEREQRAAEERADKEELKEALADEKKEKEKATAMIMKLTEEKSQLKRNSDQALHACAEQAKQELDELGVEMLAKAKKRKDLKLEMCRKELAREQLEKRQKAIALAVARSQVRMLMKEVDSLKYGRSSPIGLQRTSSGDRSIDFVGEVEGKRKAADEAESGGRASKRSALRDLRG